MTEDRRLTPAERIALPVRAKIAAARERIEGSYARHHQVLNAAKEATAQADRELEALAREQLEKDLAGMAAPR